MSEPIEKFGKGDKFNFAANMVCIIMLSIGGYFAKLIFEKSSEASEHMAIMQVKLERYASDTAIIQTQLASTRDSIQTQLELIRARLTANEIEVIKLQQQRHP